MNRTELPSTSQIVLSLPVMRKVREQPMPKIPASDQTPQNLTFGGEIPAVLAVATCQVPAALNCPINIQPCRVFLTYELAPWMPRGHRRVAAVDY